MEWINCRDRLPEDDKEVLVVLETCSFDSFEFFRFDPCSIQWCWTNRNGTHFRKRKVIYWMPMPPIPNEPMSLPEDRIEELTQRIEALENKTKCV